MSVREDLTTAAGHVAGLRRAGAVQPDRLGDTLDLQPLHDDVVGLAGDAHGPLGPLDPHGEVSRG